MEKLLNKIWTIIENICKQLHIHNFSKPITSKYVSLHHRDIIFECKCGERKLKRIYKSFGDKFPIPTNNFITNEEFDKILNK